jgi:hypothetical protein
MFDLATCYACLNDLVWPEADTLNGMVQFMAWDAGDHSDRSKTMYGQVETDLDEMVALLENDGSSWIRLFKLAKREFDHANYEACGSIILSGSGGMGSLNDLVLGQGRDESGDWVWKPGYKERNDRFQMLLGRLYASARTMASR